MSPRKTSARRSACLGTRRPSRFGDAEGHFKNAIDKHGNDARYWYYLGLAKQRQGRDAGADFKQGASLEAKGLPSSEFINTDLLRIQGPAREALNAVRP